MNKIPEDIQKAIDLLKTSEKINSHKKRIDLFTDAFDILNDSLDEHPEFEEMIKNMKKANIRNLLQKLKNTRPSLEEPEAVWYILIFLTIAKNETKSVTQEDESLWKYLIEFTSLWTEKVPSEIRTIISNELGI